MAIAPYVYEKRRMTVLITQKINSQAYIICNHAKIRKINIKKRKGYAKMVINHATSTMKTLIEVIFIKITGIAIQSKDYLLI